MIAGVLNEENNPNTPLYIEVEERTYDEATIKQLRDEYHIFFRSGGVRPVMLIPYDNEEGCCVAIGSEDDGCICFRRDMFGNFMNAMSPYWIDDLIADLTDAKEYIKNGGKV